MNIRYSILWKNTSDDKESASFVLDATNGFRGVVAAFWPRAAMRPSMTSANFSGAIVPTKTRDADRNAAALKLSLVICCLAACFSADAEVDDFLL